MICSVMHNYEAVELRADSGLVTLKVLLAMCHTVSRFFSRCGKYRKSLSCRREPVVRGYWEVILYILTFLSWGVIG